MRIGIGYDVHQLQKGRKLIIGGVQIPFDKGLLGHSDADVLIHAIIDAILGALAMGDIGVLFPDSDNRYKDVSSIALLNEVFERIVEKGWYVGNIDTVIIAEQPKLRPFISEMSAIIAKNLHLEIEQVSIKSTTTEKLGFVGREEGIAAQAVVLLLKHLS
ncbi:MAG: 2-C-methyl-D-erythritol 2,4-cyclodiphosphate synthase [SAR324 cluster bacterium]|nr:2-C-methyl-D-erythritol 2,4-cyclodiphosphate synthase [SAR324 cluster bacterium]